METFQILPKTERQANQWILIFCPIVLVLALGIGSGRSVGTFGVESDFYGVYAVQAERILNGESYTYQHNPPLYCLLLAGISLLTKNMFVAGKVISAVSLPLLGWAFYCLLKEIIDYQLAFICSILSVITLFPASFLAATDVVSTLFIFLPVLLFLRSSSLRLKTVFICGILSGIAYLFRTNAIFVPIGIILSILLLDLHRETIRQRCIKVCWFLSGLILIISPWLIYNWQVNSSFFASSAYLQIAANFYHPEGDNLITSLAEMESQFSSLPEVIFRNPFYVLKQYIIDILGFNIPKLFIPLSLVEQIPALIILPLLWVGTGLVLFVKELKNNRYSLNQKKITAFLIINLLGYLLLGLVGFHRRYYFFIYPCIFLFKIYPLIKLKCFKITLFKPWQKATLTRFLILNLFAGVTIAAGIESYLTLAAEPKYLISIAEFLKASSLPDEIIIIRKPHLAYLADLTPTFPLANTVDEYLKKAQKIGAKYLVYSDYEASLWSGLTVLSNPENLPPSLQLIYHHQATNTLIYQFHYDN